MTLAIASAALDERVFFVRNAALFIESEAISRSLNHARQMARLRYSAKRPNS